MDKVKSTSKSSSKRKSSVSSASSSSEHPKKDEKGDWISSEVLRMKLHQLFKHDDFKSQLQKDAIKEVIRGKQ